MRHILRKAYFIGKLREKLQYNMTTKIGVIQMQSTANKEWNFNQAVKYINKAIASGVKIVFLPECFDFVVLSHKETLNLAEVLKGPLVTRYCSLAARENLWISLGGAHIKSTCTQSFCESKVTRSGMEAPNVIENTPIGNLGLAICYDLRFPELASYLRYARNAHVIAYPSAFSTRTGESGHWHTLLRARAIENQCYIVASAQEGKHNEKRSSYGHSLVVDPWGQIIAEQLNPGPGLLTCEIGPFTMTNSATSSIPYIYHVRRSIPVEYHRRFDLFPMSDSGYPRSIQSADFNFGPHIIKSDCVFYQSQLSFAFVNISPLVPGHVLVCPIVCVQRFCHLNPAQIADLYMTVRQVAKRLAEYFSATSLTISIQDGKDAGQSVAHVHVHILPRKPNDFPENDDIYKALQKHDKLKSRVCRSHDVMSQEAKQLRQLYYPNNLKSSIFSQNC
ncbi:Nitrilase and fragile histidine triad fusion protein NitFhit [Schistosoma japonicum]|nr:Nitrilase and fragile histidine triad fusion protein NitFhit [Schistosoma japonicum]